MSEQLNDVQRLELELLESDADEAARSGEHARFVGALASIARYAQTEGLTVDHFRASGESSDFNWCYSATGFAQYPEDWFDEPECLGAEVLRAAGFAAPTSPQ